MSGRVYTISFAGVGVTAVQDLLAVYSGSVKAFKVHSVVLGQISATAVGNLRVSLKRIEATVTPGSGGTTPTPIPLVFTDTSATITAHVNDTSQASGTTQLLVADVFNVINGWLYLPPAEDRPVINPSQAFVVSLDTAPVSSETMSGTITVEELF